MTDPLTALARGLVRPTFPTRCVRYNRPWYRTRSEPAVVPVGFVPLRGRRWHSRRGRFELHELVKHTPEAVDLPSLDYGQRSALRAVEQSLETRTEDALGAGAHVLAACREGHALEAVRFA